MTFNPTFFALAALLLVVPLPLPRMRGGLTVFATRATNPPLAGVLRAWQNWFDLLRAAAGCWLLLEHAVVLDAKPAAELTPGFLIRAGVLAAGILAQSIRVPSLTVFVPAFYLTGIALVLPGWATGAFAAVFAWAFAIGSRQFIFHSCALAFALGVGGFFLVGLSLKLELACALMLLPLLAAVLLRRRPLFLFAERARRRPKFDDGTPTSPGDKFTTKRLLSLAA